MKTIIKTTFLTMLLFLASLNMIFTQDFKVVTFADPNLDALIRVHLRNPIGDIYDHGP